ncbi:T9SS type A sorting domain-containing protein, partial [Ulvibacter litoralis]
CAVKTWDGSNWNPAGNPTATDHVVISDDYDTTTDGGSITACEVTVDASTRLTIGADDFLSVVNDITVNGTLNVAQIASVVQIEDAATVTNNGTINVYVDTPDLNGRDFVLLGSPMSSETRAHVFENALRVRNHLTEEFSPNTEVGDGSPGAGNWVDETGNDWPVLENGPINLGEGYMVMRDLTGPPAPLNLNFNTGTLNNGVINYSAGYNGNQNSSPSILANPYASAISATDFITTNSGGVDAVYFWEHVTSPNAGLPGPFGLNYTMEDISIFNLTGGTAAAGSDSSTVPNGMISTGQGFGVKVSSAGGPVSITFNNAMRRTTGNAMPRNQNLDRIWLQVESDGYDLKSTALIGFLDQATDGFDEGYDAKRLATNVSLYSHLDDGTDVLGIQARGVFEENKKISMGFASLIDEKIDYTISIQNIEGINLGTATVYLIDTLEDVITNLSEANYTFMSEKGIYDNRFVLQFVPEVILGTNNPVLKEVAIYPNPTQGVLNIVSPKTTITSVRIFDLSGRVVLNTSDLNSNTTELNLSELNSAMYFVEVITEAGSLTERILKD